MQTCISNVSSELRDYPQECETQIYRVVITQYRQQSTSWAATNVFLFILCKCALNAANVDVPCNYSSPSSLYVNNGQLLYSQLAEQAANKKLLTVQVAIAAVGAPTITMNGR